MNSKFRFELVFLYGLFFVSIIFNYFLPSLFSYVWFLGLLIAFLLSRNQYNYLWIGLFWLILSAPGYLFFKLGTYHLPVLSVPGLGRDIYYEELFAIILVIKAFWKPVKQTVFYRKPLIVLIIYAIFLLFMGLLSGNGIVTVLKSVRYFIPILLLLYIPKLIPFNVIPRIIFLMFLSSFIMIAAQLFDIVFGYPMATILGERQLLVAGREIGENFNMFDVTRGAVRTIYGPFILLFSLVLSIVLLTEGRKIYKSWFLYLVSLISALSIFLSATRGWIIAGTLVLLGLAYFKTRRFGNYILIGIILILIGFSVPQLNMQINKSFERVLTLQSLAKGDLTAGGSLKRITIRSPRVMNKFWEQPVLGFGFSDTFYDYADGHVGNQTLLLNGGIVGYLIFVSFLFYLMYEYYLAYIKRKNKVMLVFLTGILALIIIHSTSAMVFGYSMRVSVAISLSLFFFYSDYYLKQVEYLPPVKI